MKKFLAILLLSLVVCAPDMKKIIEEVVRKMKEMLRNHPVFQFLQKIVADGTFQQFLEKYNSEGKQPAIALCTKLIKNVPEGVTGYPTVESLCSELIRLIQFLQGIYS